MGQEAPEQAFQLQQEAKQVAAPEAAALKTAAAVVPCDHPVGAVVIAAAVAVVVATAKPFCFGHVSKINAAAAVIALVAGAFAVVAVVAGALRFGHAPQTTAAAAVDAAVAEGAGPTPSEPAVQTTAAAG